MWKEIALAGPVWVAVVSGALAQEQRYSSDWQQPAVAASSAQVPTHETTQQLVDELQALIDAADTANAADPVFLADLRALALRYTWAWRTLVVSDDFGDGDYTQTPAWSVKQGTFTADPDTGLRTAVASTGGPSPETTEGSDQTPEQLAVNILGAILAGSQERGGGEVSSATVATPSQINLDAAIPNTFALRFELTTAPGSEGAIEVGVAQGERDLGYRIAYTQGGAIELLRYGSRGTGVVDTSASPVALDDGERHLVQVTRSAEGEFVVTVDDAEVMRVSDRAFRDPFERLVLINEGGDYTLRSVAVFGAT